MNVRFLVIVPQVWELNFSYLRSKFVFSSLFAICRSDWIISVALLSCTLTLPSVSYVLLLSPSTELCISVTAFVSSMLVIACWRIFTMSTLKSLSDNCAISVILVLESIDCLFSFSLRSSPFIAWQVTFDWILDIRIMRLVFIWPLCFSCFVKRCCGSGRCSHQVEVKGLHSALFAPEWAELGLGSSCHCWAGLGSSSSHRLRWRHGGGGFIAEGW